MMRPAPQSSPWISTGAGSSSAADTGAIATPVSGGATVRATTSTRAATAARRAGVAALETGANQELNGRVTISGARLPAGIGTVAVVATHRPATDPDAGFSAGAGVDQLLAWAEATGRALPWRQTRDPWAVLVSEVMLQQTQVSRVVPRYRRFLERFPTPAVCASAPVGEVIAEWVGLGYNRRAVNLHGAATVVAGEHDGRFPDALDDLIALPGVGPYTARAVLVFAFERDIGVVDTNVGRILARTRGRRLSPRQAQDLADQWVPSGRGWRWNQALFDLGAGVCTKREPRCGRCPLRGVCRWRGVGDDPATGSAATSRPQARFEGSFRQGRGRLVAALGHGPVLERDVAEVVGWAPGPRVDRCVAALVDDGLIVVDDGQLRLAGG